MTVVKRHARRMALPAAAVAALLLAGCSSGHVGEDWQCPLAAAGSCDSVAAADPAVPKTDAAQAPVTGRPLRLLPRENDADEIAAPPAWEPGQASMETRTCEADCGFDPFSWLARLFDGSDDDDRPGGGNAEPATVHSATAVAATSKSRSSDSAAALPAGAAPADDGPDGGDLRTGEIVARIWIAPFVDADGVYREASHVRVVLEPAGWRLR